MLTEKSEKYRRIMLEKLQERYVEKFRRLKERTIILKDFLEIIPDSHLRGYGIRKKDGRVFLGDYSIKYSYNTVIFYYKDTVLNSDSINQIENFVNRLDGYLEDFINNTF